MDEHFDVLVVGAGLSGISAGYHLQRDCPNKTFAILESRDAIGGTWDLFRYPGIRSDSDMYTLGYRFRPWKGEQSIADGPSILEYVRDTARETGVDKKIRFGHRVERASWSSDRAQWIVEVRKPDTGEVVRFTCRFLMMCTGYYDYEGGYAPEFPGMSRFAGRVIHPQKWTEDVVTKDKRVVVIGSGATAVTTTPALARTAAHVTMLQRSPSFIVSRPGDDRLAARLKAWLPARMAAGLARWIDVLIGSAGYFLARRRPAMVRRALMAGIQRDLGPDYDVAKDFSPPYNPWDQRVCMTPDGELFAAIRDGKVSVATDMIDSFTETGIRLKSGRELAADIVVPATGLVVKLMGGMDVMVDGVRANLAERLVYKGMMFSDVPNLALAFGYINASWTLKCDLTARAVCRLIKYMDQRGFAFCLPRVGSQDVGREPMLNFTSGYVRRAEGVLPHQGSKAPWRVHQNYLLDMLVMRFGRVEDGVLEFAKGPQR